MKTQDKVKKNWVEPADLTNESIESPVKFKFQINNK